MEIFQILNNMTAAMKNKCIYLSSNLHEDKAIKWQHTEGTGIVVVQGRELSPVGQVSIEVKYKN